MNRIDFRRRSPQAKASCSGAVFERSSGTITNHPALKTVLILIQFALVGAPIFAQKVFVVDHAYQADVLVYVVDYAYQADLKVYLVDHEYQAELPGKWFTTAHEYQADLRIHFVDYPYQADLKIFYVEYASQAGWRDGDKSHLLRKR